MSRGLDIPIDNLLALFVSHLWASNTKRQFFGRVFRNERFENFQSKISPEVWISINEPAKEVLKNDNYDAQCFFDPQPNETITNGDVHTATVRICFMVKLFELYPLLSRQEATEQVHTDAEELIAESSEFTNVGLVRGFTGFTDYDWGDPGSADQARSDMNKNYLFRFDANVEYINC